MSYEKIDEAYAALVAAIKEYSKQLVLLNANHDHYFVVNATGGSAKIQFYRNRYQEGVDK